jgi:phosphatidylglycerophosphate synthase
MSRDTSVNDFRVRRKNFLVWLYVRWCSIYIYTVADHLDGMQARRSRLGTRIGALLDHLCDFFNGSLSFWVRAQPLARITLSLY